MLKKVIAAAALIALAVGSAAGVRTIAAGDGGASCQKPLTFLDSEQRASIDTLEAYIATEIAPLFNHPDQFTWFPESVNPTLKPGRIAAVITVAEVGTGEARTYSVELIRECAGGGWKVVKFELVDGQKPEPKAAKKGATA